MLWTILAVILVVWLFGGVIMPIGGGLIHLLLVLAVIVLILQLVPSMQFWNRRGP